MKKILLLIISCLMISCSTTNFNSTNLEKTNVNKVELKDIKNDDIKSKNEINKDKIYNNIEEKSTFRKQQITDSIIDMVINDKPIKIVYIRDKIIFDKMKNAFKNIENVGILYKTDISNLTCVEKDYDVLFLNEDMEVVSKGLSIVSGKVSATCSTKMIKTSLLLPKNLINIENINIGDIINIDYNDRIPLNKNMIK